MFTLMTLFFFAFMVAYCVIQQVIIDWLKNYCGIICAICGGLLVFCLMTYLFLKFDGRSFSESYAPYILDFAFPGFFIFGILSLIERTFHKENDATNYSVILVWVNVFLIMIGGITMSFISCWREHCNWDVDFISTRDFSAFCIFSIVSLIIVISIPIYKHFIS